MTDPKKVWLKVMILVEVDDGPRAQDRAIERTHWVLSGVGPPWQMRVGATAALKRARAWTDARARRAKEVTP